MTGEPTAPGRRHRRRLAWILVFAFAIRIVAGVLSGMTIGGDASEYLQLAHNLAGGHGFSLAQHSPFTAMDWREPGYPAMLVPVAWLGAGHFGAVVLNALLGTIAVLALALIGCEVFAASESKQLAVALLAATYPPSVTFTGLVLSENLLYAAGSWFIYLAFFAPIVRTRPLVWLAGLFVAGALVAAARTEGVLLAVIGIALALSLRRPPVAVAVAAVAVVLVAPALWAVRNDAALGRFELVDSAYRDANLLLSVNDGNAADPLFVRGVALGHIGESSALARARYESAVGHRISRALRDQPGRVLSFKVKGLADFPFVPPVWNWAIERFSRNYLLSHAARNLGPRNAIRLAWSLLLLVQYGLALLGLSRWFRRRQYRYVIGLLLYPCLALALTIPFQADPREWSFAALLLLVPAVEGGARLWPASSGPS